MDGNRKRTAAQQWFEDEAEKKDILSSLREADPKKAIEILRDRARKSYVQQRKIAKLHQMHSNVGVLQGLEKNDLLNDRQLFELEYQKQVLKMAGEFLSAKRIDEIGAYIMPEGDKGVEDRSEFNEAYRSGRRDDNDYSKWEQEKLRHSVIFKKNNDTTNNKNNEMVLDFAQIEFLAESSEKNAESIQQHEQLLREYINTKKQEKLSSIRAVRESLPVFQYKDAFLDAVKEHQVLIIVGETGSGKTTQLPQYLLEDEKISLGKSICCTQPRRVAAMSVAQRVAEEMNEPVGRTVGYSIRFENVVSDATRIKYMTDGMLLREFMTQPDLTSYSVIMIDEAHERTLHTDILFGLVKDLARYRPDLRLLISSATMDADKFSEFFDDAPIFKVPGRRFPVDIYYTKAPEADYMNAAVVTILQIHLTQPLQGDILVFLPGQEEIEATMELLEERVKTFNRRVNELIVLPIYANLPADQQAKIFQPTPASSRKVILATNIAETSITIDNILYVIDPGFCKLKGYNPKNGMETLTVVPVSKASAEQRAGRAGRVAPGKCFRLYTAEAYTKELEDSTPPEIQRTNLSSVILLLKSLGISNLVEFDYMDPPSPEGIMTALEELYALGALNKTGQMTQIGRRMAELPLDPMLAKMILTADQPQFKCVEEALIIASMLSVNSSVFYRPKNKKIYADSARKSLESPFGDHLTLLNVYQQWAAASHSAQWCFDNFVQHKSMRRAQDIYAQLERNLKNVEIAVSSVFDNKNQSKSENEGEADVKLRKVVLSGYFYNVAHSALSAKTGGMYKTLKHNCTVAVHPSSCLAGKEHAWLLYHELVETTKEYMRNVIAIDKEWILEVAPHYYTEKNLDSENEKKKKTIKGNFKSGKQLM